MAVEAATATVKIIRESIFDDDDDDRRVRELMQAGNGEPRGLRDIDFLEGCRE
jgi:hypothetical protein